MIAVKKVSFLRTVEGCLEFIKKYDPETVVSTFYIRELIRKGEIIPKHSGNKPLINLIELLSYLGFEVEAGPFPSVEETLGKMDGQAS